MSKFKVGDKVRCIVNPEDLDPGAEYTVREVDIQYNCIKLAERPGSWSGGRFELVKPYSFKPGDRVAVAFETTINSIVGDNAYFAGGLATTAAPLSSLTKLTEPLPTRYGAVIRINGTGTIYEYNGYGIWFIPGDTTAYKTEPRGEAVEYGFTVLYAGDGL